MCSVIQPKTWEMSLKTEPSVASDGTDSSGQGDTTKNFSFLLTRGEKKKEFLPLKDIKC